MIDEIVRRVRRREARALARAITLIEQRAPERIPLLKALFPYSGHARIIGITGAPGSGKSTLVGQLIRSYREKENSVAVVAVDPSSPFSGGATLGDRIRMQTHNSDSEVFIRSMASRGQLGGLAPSTADVAMLLDAAGWHTILVETVGIGQDQLDIASVADVLLVLLVPGMGDEIQIAKAGVLEAADVYVVNKSDREGAYELERALLDNPKRRSDGWIPPTIRTTASSGGGIAELTAAIDSYYQHIQDRGLLQVKNVEKWRTRLLRMLEERVAERLLHSDYGPLFHSYAGAVAEHRIDPYTVVEHLLGRSAMQKTFPAEPLIRRRA